MRLHTVAFLFISCLAAASPAAQAAEDTFSIASFTIPELGLHSERRADLLAHALTPHDIVVINGLMAPPSGQIETAQDVAPTESAADFFAAMIENGFSWSLAEVASTTPESIQATPESRWSCIFYQPSSVSPAPDLLPADALGNPVAFTFQSNEDENVLADRTRADFILLPVHLPAGDDPALEEQRADTLHALTQWAAAQPATETDFLLLGTMNFSDASEAAAALPEGWASLNDAPMGTTSETHARPADHIWIRPEHTGELGDFRVDDLVAHMRTHWDEDRPFPGDSDYRAGFHKLFSAHHPIAATWTISKDDDESGPAPMPTGYDREVWLAYITAPLEGPEPNRRIAEMRIVAATNHLRPIINTTQHFLASELDERSRLLLEAESDAWDLHHRAKARLEAAPKQGHVYANIAHGVSIVGSYCDRAAELAQWLAQARAAEEAEEADE